MKFTKIEIEGPRIWSKSKFTMDLVFSREVPAIEPLLSMTTRISLVDLLRSHGKVHPMALALGGLMAWEDRCQ